MDGGDIMYSYKQLTDSKNINMIKKAHGKFLIPLIVSLVFIANIILILLFYLATKNLFLESSYRIYIPLVLIVLQIILGVIIYGKYINKVVMEWKKPHGEIEIGFNEKGLTIKENESLIEISWEGIKEVRRKYINKVVMEWKKPHGEIEIGFNEKGLTIKENESLIEISWEGIKEVRIYDGYIIFISKISCILSRIMTFDGFNVSRIMTFDGFNVEKDMLISDIEKYKKVRWYYNEF